MTPDALAWDIKELKEDKKYPNLETEYYLCISWNIWKC